MLENSTSTVAKSDESFVLIKRVFDAPRELVFKAWLDPEQLHKWFAPRGCTIRFHKLEPRVGGKFHSCIRIPDGRECWCAGVYREIVVPERIVFTMAIADASGNLVGPVDAGMDPDWPRETVVTVTLVERDGKTELTLHQSVSESLAKRTGAHPSWIQMLERLAEELTKA